MNRTTDILVTAIAPVIWGSTYLVVTETLPEGNPVVLAALRALPAGLLLLAITRRLPPVNWLGKTFVLASLNFAVMWTLLFIAAYRLPGGLAAVLAALQPLLVIGLSRGLLNSPARAGTVAAAASGALGVGLMLLSPEVVLDPLGIAAGLGGVTSMAAGTVLSRKWQPPVSALSFAAWQLTAGGLLLAVLALVMEPRLPAISHAGVAGLAWISLAGAALAYWLWFRGLARLEPSTVSILGMMSPVTAVAAGWIWLDEELNALQLTGAVIVLTSVIAGQIASRPVSKAKTAAAGSKHEAVLSGVVECGGRASVTKHP